MLPPRRRRGPARPGSPGIGTGWGSPSGAAAGWWLSAARKRVARRPVDPGVSGEPGGEGAAWEAEEEDHWGLHHHAFHSEQSEASEGPRPPGTSKGLRPHTLETALEGTQLQGPRAAETATPEAAAAVPPQGRPLAVVCGVEGLRHAEVSAPRPRSTPTGLGGHP